MSSDPQKPWRERVTEAARTWMPGTSTERLLLWLFVVLATVLRCWDLPHIPYTHDELSALLRVDHPTLRDAIQKGVVGVDTHPPGVHAFTWAWTKLFGFGEGVVKLPFILLSIAAIVLLYRFMQAWVGGTVALLCTALLATLQYTVMYGQIARPYAFGLFTTALLADQLTRYLGNGSRKALIGLAAGALLSAWTHHFALMLAAFMWATGLFLVTREQRRGYLIAGGAAVLLYLPNVSLFIAQLGWKGLDEWLNAPTASWIPGYAWWIAHCSPLFAVVLGALVVASIVLRVRSGGGTRPVWIIALIWGVLPLAIGYGYSLWRSPVLQYSVVLFSFPYVLMGIFAGLRYLRASYAPALAVTVAACSMFTLVLVRRHYATFYRSKYEAIAHGVVEAGREHRTALIDAPDRMVKFYLHHWGVDSASAPYINIHDATGGFIDSVAQHAQGPLFYGQSSAATPENIGRLQGLWPFLVERHDFVEGQTFLFAGSPLRNRVNDLAGRSTTTPRGVEGTGWKMDQDLPLWRDTTVVGSPVRWDFTGREWGALFESPVRDLTQGENDLIEVSADVEALVPDCGIRLSVELKEGDSTRFYRSDLVPATPGQHKLWAVVKLADMDRHGAGMLLRAYIWNERMLPARVSSLTVQVRKGDPWLYGFFQPLKGPLEFP